MKTDEKIHIDPSIPLPSDKFTWKILASRDEDKRAIEEYLSEKYHLDDGKSKFSREDIVRRAKHAVDFQKENKVRIMKIFADSNDGRPQTK